MRYKITNIYNQTFYINEKKELFKYIDELTYFKNKSTHHSKYFFYNSPYNGFFRIVTNDFNKTEDSSKGSVFLYSEQKSIKNRFTDYYYMETKNTYSTGFCKIKDEKGFTIDYSKLYSEYKQSRFNLSSKKKNRRYIDRSTKKYQLAFKDKAADHIMSSCKKEYTDCLSIKEIENELDLNIKIRRKRLSFLKCLNVHTYDDFIERKARKSWKNKKVKRQWKKNSL